MNSIKLLQSRAVIATMLLFSFLVMEENGPARGIDDTGSVTVTAQVSEEPPLCQDEALAISFAPAIDSSSGGSLEGIIYIELPNTSDSISINLLIDDGYTEDCDFIYGSVDFRQGGFFDLGTEASVNFLTATFSCDLEPASLTPNEGEYSCSGMGGGSPDSIDMNVTADAENAYIGYFSNTISLSLTANP